LGDDPLFEFCEVCLWQYDPVTHDKPDSLVGANYITLNEARLNYRKYGASKEKYKGNVRKPRDEELPQNNKPKFSFRIKTFFRK